MVEQISIAPCKPKTEVTMGLTDQDDHTVIHTDPFRKDEQAICQIQQHTSWER